PDRPASVPSPDVAVAAPRDTDLNPTDQEDRTMTMITSPCATKRRDALVERLFESAIGMLDVMSVYVGDRLGLYEVLAERSSLTARQLAQATGTNERYIREWLEQQASTGILEAEDDGAPHLRGNPETRRFSLPAGHAEVLIDRDSLN